MTDDESRQRWQAAEEARRLEARLGMPGGESWEALYQADQIRRLPPRDRRAREQLTLWCETGRDRVGTVYPRGRRLLLVLTSGESKPAEERARRLGLPEEEWIKALGSYWLDGPSMPTGVDFTCRCRRAEPRRLVLLKVAQLAADPERHSANVSELMSD